MSLNMATVRIILTILLWWSCLAPAWAVQFGAGTGSTYPTTLDSTNPRTNKSGVACNSAVTSNACAEHINDLQDAAVKTETELGVLPKGTSATVKERIVGIRSLSGATPDTIVVSADQVGIGTATPTAFALLDLASTTKAFIIPRMTSAQKNAITAADGMMVYDTTLAQYQFRQGGAWVGLSGATAPTDAGYWVDAANGTLSAERNLGALTTGLVLNTVTAGVGVPSAYGGTLCTNQFPRSLNASAVATCASVSLTADVTGDLPYANLVQATAASKILVRGSAAGGGDWEEGTLGSGLTMTGTTLSAAGSATITAATATVATVESTTSTTYTDLATSGPAVTVTVGPSGILLIGIKARFSNDTALAYAYTSFALSGGNTLAAADANNSMQRAGTGNEFTFSSVFLKTGLAAASTTITLKYRVNANTGTWSNRDVWVLTW